MTVNVYARLDEMDAGCPKSRHTDGQYTINERLTCDVNILVSK